MNHSIKNLVLCLAVAALVTGCLKTRSQLREDQDDSVQPSSPPVSQYAIDEMKSEITRLSGRMEDLERSNKKLQSDGESAKADEVKKLEDRIVAIEQSQMAMIEAIKKLEGAPVQSDNPEELFMAGAKQFRKGDYEQSIKTLTAYLETSKPKNQVEATFLRGEAFFELKQYKKAIVDFSKFAEKKMGQSSFVPKALYKLALSFEGLGRSEDAKAFYEEVVDSYPKSKEAKLAQAHLKGGKKQK